MVGLMRSVHVKGSAILVVATACVYIIQAVVGSMNTLVPLLAVCLPQRHQHTMKYSWASHGDTITGWHRMGNLIMAKKSKFNRILNEDPDTRR